MQKTELLLNYFFRIKYALYIYMQSSIEFLPFLYKILFSQNFTSYLHSNLKDIENEKQI